MSKEPKVSEEEREAQTERLYAKVGKIAAETYWRYNPRSNAHPQEQGYGTFPRR